MFFFYRVAFSAKEDGLGRLKVSSLGAIKKGQRIKILMIRSGKETMQRSESILFSKRIVN